MSTFFTSTIGAYTLAVEDTTGSAPSLGRVQCEAIAPPWGELRRTKGTGVYPTEFSVSVVDPRDKIKDRLTGNLTEDDWEVTIEGPPGPTGNRYLLKLYPKSKRRTDPISDRRYPDRTTLTFYDGLTSTKEDTLTELEKFSTDFLTAGLRDAFVSANDTIGAFLGWAHSHRNRGGTKIGVTDTDVHFDDRTWKSFQTYWDLLLEVAERYSLKIFQSPFHRAFSVRNASPDPAAQRPTFLAMTDAKMGLNRDGIDLIGGAPATLSENEVTITKDSLIQNEGREYRKNVAITVEESLGKEKNQDTDALVLNGDDSVRDGEYVIEVSGGGLMYGARQDISIVSRGSFQDSADKQIELAPPQGGESVWRSNGFHTGDGVKFFQVKWHLEVTSGSRPTDFVARVYTEDESGTEQQEWTLGATAASSFATKDGTIDGNRIVFVEVVAPRDASGNEYKVHFALESLRLWRDSRDRSDNNLDEVLSRINYQPSDSGFVKREIGPVTDVLANQDTSGIRRATEVYRNEETGALAWTAGQMIYEDLKSYRPTGTQTLESTIDQIIGPNTRIVVQDESRSLTRRLIMHGGRRQNLRNGYTELADIEIPDFS